MIYLVTDNPDLQTLGINLLTVKESLNMISSWPVVQFDTETSGKNPHLCKLLCMQFGSPDGQNQVVVDCNTIKPETYKYILESRYIIGQNLKFDLQFLYNYTIIPRYIYDTMIVEQFLYLGWPSGLLSFSLKAIADRRLGIQLDKSVRGEIIWRGLDKKVIEYAASDVMYLCAIMNSQKKALKQIDNGLKGASIECAFTPVIAYLEWCGIKLDEEKWKNKMKRDQKNLIEAEQRINDYIIAKAKTIPALNKFVSVDTQGDLFSGYNLTPKVTLNWQSPKAIEVYQILGFNTTVTDKETGEEKESALEKHLTMQKGIADDFLKLMFGWDEITEGGEEIHHFGYQEAYKLCSTYGQGHLNAVNPKTGRIHTIYRAIGTRSGRMSSGSRQPDVDLAKYKHLFPKECTYPNMQQLPHDAVTRACFISEPGNLFCSCDWSAMEARIGADVYNEKMLLDEFLYRSGDTHAAYAKVVFANELKDVPIEKIKKVRPDLRTKVKSVEFAVQFGSDGTAVAPQLGIPVEEARKLVNNLLQGMQGLASFKEYSSKRVRELGYVEVNRETGHRIHWYDWPQWKARQERFTREFWEDYKTHHKGTNDNIAIMVRNHFKAASSWDRMALNGPTQGGGAICLKEAATELFNWIVDNGYFNKILIVNLTHDEINSEFPKELKNTYPSLVANIMKKACAKYYHKLPIPAEAEVSDHWVH